MSAVFDAAMKPLEALHLLKRRRSLLPEARGKTLEIGIGTGVNFPYYNFIQLEELHLLDKSIRGKARNYPFGKDLPVKFYEQEAEDLPFPQEYFDTVVFTLVFCTIADPDAAMAEVYRVLKQAGRILFIEHVEAKQHITRKGQEFANLLWPKLSGGCNLIRRTDERIRRAGFSLCRIERFAREFFIAGIGMKT